MADEVEVLQQALFDLRRKVRSFDVKLRTASVISSPELSEKIYRQRAVFYKEISEIKIKLEEVKTINESSESTRLTLQIKEIKEDLTYLDRKYVELLRIKLFNIGRKANNLNTIERDLIKREIKEISQSLTDWEKKEMERIDIKNLLIKQKYEEEKEGKLQITQQYHRKEDTEISNKEEQLPLKNISTNSAKQFAIKIPWIDVVFRDGYINMRWNGKNIKVHCSQSTQSFNYLKDNISIFQNTFLNIKQDKSTEQFVIDNLATLEMIIDRLKIEQYLTNADIDNSKYIYKTIFSRWNNSRIINAYGINRRTSYLSYLCNIYSESHHIVPVKEKRLNESNKSIIAEDAFLFPIYIKNWLFILWESVEESRATYIFRCQHINYERAIQKVFDYIASPDVTNKRDRLRQGEVGYFKGEVVEYYHSLNHDNISDWQQRLVDLCK